MSTNYDTERSNVADHVTRIVETFFSELDPRSTCGQYEGVLDKTRTRENDLSLAVTTALETEISKMEEQGKPVGDMSRLSFQYQWVSQEVSDVWMVGSINGEGWSGNLKRFNVYLGRWVEVEDDK
ncbi:hypothetical protein B9479_008261 [Cryptococcus floricola]|uniref:Uncharacterized protein n=1 Tax=Cryptococcus floricola TaxID=2591691 RepID=A0A5D3AMD3_9TREE|nr:hypothetical protein B9479_008261 [Cryptococcus floricola]